MKARFLFLAFVAGCLAFWLGYSAAPSPHGQVVFDAAAVKVEGGGALTAFKVSVAPGSGRLLLDVSESRYGEDTEKSMAEAREAAQEILGRELGDRDLVFEFVDAETYVSGESGGAAFATAIIAAVTGIEPRSDGVVSAQLDGLNLKPIGGADEKILAAIAAGKKFFVVADGQEIKFEEDLSKRIQIIRVKTLPQAVRLLLNV